MAAFDFPASPTDGQEYSPAPGVTYVWHDPAWEMKPDSGGGGGAATYVGDLPPETPIPGQLWWESFSGNTYIWYDDGNTQQWVMVSGFGAISALMSNYVQKAGDIMTGNLVVAKADPVLVLNKSVDGSAMLIGAKNGPNRWAIELGNGIAESGAEVGSNFSILSFNDAGALLSVPFEIERKTSQITMPVPPKMPAGFRATNGGNTVKINWGDVAGGPSIDIDGAFGPKLLWSDIGAVFGQSGINYMKFPNRFTIQWGYYAGGGEVTITFPIAFSVIYSVVTVGVGTLPATSSITCNVTNVAAGSFYLQPRYVNNGGAVGAASQGYHWIAVGIV